MSDIRTAILVTRRVNADDGATFVEEGDPVTSLRGEAATFQYASRARVPGKSGKVVVQWADGSMREYYDNAFGLEVSGILTCGCPHYIVWDEGHQDGCTERTAQ